MNAEPPLAGPVIADPLAGLSETRLIVCEEYGTINLRISELMDPSGRLLLNPEIESAGYFTVVLSKGNLTLRARGQVGFIPLNGDSVVYVRPRVPIANLTRMVEITGEHPSALSLIRTYATGRDWGRVHVDLYATALSRRVREIMLAGFLREYQRREAVSSFPRGRVLMHRTTQSLVNRGIRHAVYSTWFEREVDNASNRCLKYAMFLLAEHYMRSPPAISAARHQYRELVGLYHAFGDVTLDHCRRFLDDPVVRGRRELPAARAYYRDALDVACAIVEGRPASLDSPGGGSLRLPSVVIDTARLFESYVRTSLALHAAEQGWQVDVLDGNREGARPLFADEVRLTATPDIVISAGIDTTALVLDVKDTPTGRYQRDAVEQVVTYALCYGSANALLVHPCARGQPGGLQTLGMIGGITVHVYRFDLGAGDGAAEDRRFGAAVATLLPSSALPAEAGGSD